MMTYKNVEICHGTYNFGIHGGDDSVGGKDEIEGEHGGAW